MAVKLAERNSIGKAKSLMWKPVCYLVWGKSLGTEEGGSDISNPSDLWGWEGGLGGGAGRMRHIIIRSLSVQPFIRLCLLQKNYQMIVKRIFHKKKFLTIATSIYLPLVSARVCRLSGTRTRRTMPRAGSSLCSLPAP